MFGLSKEAAALLAGCAVLICKAIYAVVIYKSSVELGKQKQGFLAGASLAFPIISGIICAVKCKQGKSARVKILITLVLTLGISAAVVITVSNAYAVKYYDANGGSHGYASEVFYKDREGNRYTFSEDTGYDRLYINETEESLNADLCYLDKDGYLVYDEDMSVTARDEASCADIDGAVYYPVKYATYNQDGSVNYHFNPENFSFDRFGKAYTYDKVPFYDKNLNKYAYSFDSDQQKGFYTNILTGEKLENEYCFVDEDGYLVYDENHAFTMYENDEGIKTYTDSDGKTYFWASGIHWDQAGNMLDSSGNILSA